MIAQVDEDGNGKIDFEEFSKMMLTRMADIERQEKTIQKVFKVIVNVLNFLFYYRGNSIFLIFRFGILSSNENLNIKRYK